MISSVRVVAELEALEDLHLWHTAKLSPDLVEFLYASKYYVSIPCTKYTPICPQVQVRKTEQAKLKEKDSFPHFTELIVKTARKLIAESQEKLSLKQVRTFSLSNFLGPSSTRSGIVGCRTFERLLVVVRAVPHPTYFPCH